ncbi:MAG: 2OG-Fe(II) oxygenase [Bacilli bacterium]
MGSLAQEQSIFNHKGNKIQTSDREISIIAAFEEPKIVVLGNVLSPEECDTIIRISNENMQRSRIGASKEADHIRTSRSTFLSEDAHPIVYHIEQRIAQIMGIPYAHGEGIQVLNYAVGQEYKPHFDYFAKGTKAAENPRISTLVMYLSDVEEGGETYFPDLKFSVSPQQGMAVYFEYFYDEQSLNDLTLHGSAPVISGNKWAATQWMHRQQVK